MSSTAGPLKKKGVHVPPLDGTSAAHHAGGARTTHMVKSAMLAGGAIEEIMARSPRGLPPIAADPFKQFRPEEKPPDLLASNSPYCLGSAISMRKSAERAQNLSPEEKYFSSLFVPSPPKSRVEDAHSPPRARPTPTAGEEMEPSELTLTYLKILQKSEDFLRRASQQEEAREMNVFKRQRDAFQEIVQFFVHAANDINALEQKKRKEAEAEEAKEREKLARHAASSCSLAKRHEDVKPQCPVLAKGQSVILDPEVTRGVIAELRWRGDIEAALYALLFDDTEKLMAVASMNEVAKGRDRELCVSRFGEMGTASGIAIGGAKLMFHVLLDLMTVKTKRCVFCVVNRAPNSTLEPLTRAWFTLRVPADPREAITHRTKRTKELYASSLVEGGHSGLAIASLVRRGTGEAWMFQCSNEPFLWANTPTRLASHLTAIYRNGTLGVEQEAAASYERLAFQYIFQFWSDVCWTLLCASEQEGWEALTKDFSERETEIVVERTRRARSIMKHGNLLSRKKKKFSVE